MQGSQPDVKGYFRVVGQPCPREYFQDLQSHIDTCVYNILTCKCIYFNIFIYTYAYTHRSSKNMERLFSQSSLNYTGTPDRSAISSVLVFRHTYNDAFWNILGTIE